MRKELEKERRLESSTRCEISVEDRRNRPRARLGAAAVWKE
jgi:hypothetical protein